MYRRTATVAPRLAREGWVPAGPDKRVNKRAMLIPKTGDVTTHIPTLLDFSEVICPPERRALREIVETAEVVREGDHLYLLARVSSATDAQYGTSTAGDRHPPDHGHGDGIQLPDHTQPRLHLFAQCELQNARQTSQQSATAERQKPAARPRDAGQSRGRRSGADGI